MVSELVWYVLGPGFETKYHHIS